MPNGTTTPGYFSYDVPAIEQIFVKKGDVIGYNTPPDSEGRMQIEEGNCNAVRPN